MVLLLDSKKIGLQWRQINYKNLRKLADSKQKKSAKVENYARFSMGDAKLMHEATKIIMTIESDCCLTVLSN